MHLVGGKESGKFRLSPVNLDDAEDVVLGVSIHQSQIGTFDSTMAENRVSESNRLMMPFFVAFAGHGYSRLHGRRTGIVIEFPCGALLSVIPDDVHRHDFGLAVLGESIMQFEIHRILAGSVLEASRKAGINGRRIGDRAADAPQRDGGLIRVDLVEQPGVVVRPDLPADVIESGLVAPLLNLAHREGLLIVVRRTGGAVEWDGKRDVWYHDEIAKMSSECTAETMDAEDPLYILYTSGSTGKPKGVLHTIGGYMLWASITHKYTFDYHAPNPISGEQGDIFWCTADIGWVTGHTYGVYGPLLNAATSIMYEGIPTYPDYSRFWKIIDKHKVTIFHTAPTAIRALMREGDDYVTKTSRKSLRLIGSVGEPINPEAWLWYWRLVGEKRCPIVDTWWQTETGGNMIAPFPGATDLKPGSATLPFFGVQPVILSPEGKVLSGACEGLLCIKDSWPGQARTIYGDHARFEQTYFSQMSGYYFTGDGAKRDADGYYWITGRVDDVLNVSGHRLGTAEIESALVAHKHVAEAAVVGFPHDIKGQGIYAYVTLNAGVETHESLHKELVQHVRMQISPIATPDHIHFTPALPKTRSGKIMRRILRKIAEGETDSLGDTSTLTNPEIVDVLIKDKKR